MRPIAKEVDNVCILTDFSTVQPKSQAGFNPSTVSAASNSKTPVKT